MKELLAIGLGLAFATLNVVSILHGKRWEQTGSPWSWHLPVLTVLGATAFVTQSYLSRQEASHLFMAFVDGVLVVGTVGLLYLIYRESTSPIQWLGMAVVIIGLLMVSFGKSGQPPLDPPADPSQVS